MSLKKYIAEAEARQEIPEAGDNFAIELEDGTLLETYIISVSNDTIVVDSTPRMLSVLREWADLDGEASDVLLEGQFKQRMHQTAESMDLKDFVDRFGHLFSPGEAEQFWRSVNDVEETDYSTEIDIVDQGEYDNEGDMAKDDLATIVRAARRLTGMLDDNENMPEWVQSKINKAADYVDTAADYIESNRRDYVDESHADTSPVASAVLRRIMMQHPGVLATHGPEKVMNAVDQLADYVGDVEEIGTSDGSGWTRDVIRMLAELPDEPMNVGDALDEADYQGRKVPLGKPMRGDVKKFKVYVKDPSTGNIKKVNFGHGGTSAKRAGQKTMKIKKSDPARRRSFRARHNCDNPGPRTKARYWSCRAW